MFIRRVIILGIMSTSLPLFAIPFRNVSFDVGGGTPQLLFVQANVVISKHFQAGAAYSLVPNSLLFGSGFTLPEQMVSINNGTTEGLFSITPTVRLRATIISPYIRVFPTERNFYFQIMYPMYMISANVGGPLQNVNGDITLTTLISSTISLNQPLPTISIGHVFDAKLFFFNLSLGASFFARIKSSITIDGAFPDALSNSEANQQALDSLQKQFETEINQGAQEFKKQLFLIPSINISMGVML